MGRFGEKFHRRGEPSGAAQTTGQIYVKVLARLGAAFVLGLGVFLLFT